MSTNYLGKEGTQHLLDNLKDKVGAKVDKVDGKGLSTNDLTSTLKSNYDTAYTHSQATHARTDATKVEASTTNGNIKINGTETTVYTHPTGTNPHGTTKSDVGLGNVGNFKAVSTVASQGLTDTEKSNARANIGAGTSSFSGSYNDLTNKPTIPSAVTESTVSGWGFTKNTGTYSKPSTGIPKTDLASDVQTSLGKADTALQSHQDISGKLDTSLKGAANGLAELDANGLVPSSQLPSYVDDVLEYTKKDSFPASGETGKIYVDTTTNLTYRWSGSAYVEISPSLALGETSSTAYRGDRGKTAYDHSQATHAPSDAQKNVQSDWDATSGDALILNKPSSFPPSSHTHDDRYYTESEMNTKLSGKLEKITYEWSKSIAFSSSGYLLIGKFPMYDTNITIDIDSTTSTTYHATCVIATQNINSSRGGTYVVNTYGDVSDTASSSFVVQYSSGSNKFNVYFKPQAWSKNLVHIRAVALNDAPNESEICTNVASVPTTDLVTVNNLLKTALDTKQDKTTAVTHTASTAAGSATQPVYVNASGVATATTYSLGKSVPSDAVFTDTNTVTAIASTTGSGNAVTAISASDGQLTITKGTTFLTSHQDISGKANTSGTYDSIYSGMSKKLQTYKQGSTTETYGASYPVYAQWRDNSHVKLKCDSYTTEIDYADSAGNASKVNNLTVETAVPANAKFTDTVTTATTSGSGNAVTAISATNGALTVTKGTTFLTSHQDISGKQDKLTAGSNITISGSTISATDTNTWNANSVSVAGYVSAPTSSNANKVWKTDASGNPGWRDDANTTYNFGGTTFYSGNSSNAEHDANSITKNGTYYYASNGPATTLGASTADGALYAQSYSDAWVGQIAQDYRDGTLFVRGKNNGTWKDWLSIPYSTGGQFTVEKSVPSDAVFTDTNTWRPIGTGATDAAAGNHTHSNYLTGITSTQVTTALGFTPYNATNPNGYTSNTGTITGIKMNGSSKGTSGEVNLGTVLTSHQDISGKYDKTGGTISGHVYLSGNKRLYSAGSDSVNRTLIYNDGDYVQVGNTTEATRLYGGDGTDSCAVTLTKDTLRPVSTYAEKISLGSSSNRWGTVYATNGNFSGNLTVSGTLNATVSGTQSKLTVASVTSASKSCAYNANTSISVSVAKDGYTPLGILGFSLSSSSPWVYATYLSGTTAYCKVRNQNSAVSATCTFYVLYEKN